MPYPDLSMLDYRRRAVALVVALTSGTPLAPQPYERHLLALYQAGVLTLEEVEELLALGVYQLIYHSQVTAPPTEAQLQDLLEQARTYNQQHQITGLLLYSDGCYVQVLEGLAHEVKALYARIQRDARHQQVTTVQAGPVERRRFTDWRMGFGRVAPTEVNQALEALQPPLTLADQTVQDAHLWALLAVLEPDVRSKQG